MDKLRKRAIEDLHELADTLEEDRLDGRAVPYQLEADLRNIAVELQVGFDFDARLIAHHLEPEDRDLLPQSVRDYLGIQEKNDG